MDERDASRTAEPGRGPPHCHPVHGALHALQDCLSQHQQQTAHATQHMAGFILQARAATSEREALQCLHDTLNKFYSLFQFFFVVCFHHYQLIATQLASASQRWLTTLRDASDGEKESLEVAAEKLAKAPVEAHVNCSRLLAGLLPTPTATTTTTAGAEVKEMHRATRYLFAVSSRYAAEEVAAIVATITQDVPATAVVLPVGLAAEREEEAAGQLHCVALITPQPRAPSATAGGAHSSSSSLSSTGASAHIGVGHAATVLRLFSAETLYDFITQRSQKPKEDDAELEKLFQSLDAMAASASIAGSPLSERSSQATPRPSSSMSGVWGSQTESLSLRRMRLGPLAAPHRRRRIDTVLARQPAEAASPSPAPAAAVAEMAPHASGSAAMTSGAVPSSPAATTSTTATGNSSCSGGGSSGSPTTTAGYASLASALASAADAGGGGRAAAAESADASRHHHHHDTAEAVKITDENEEEEEAEEPQLTQMPLESQEVAYRPLAAAGEPADASRSIVEILEQELYASRPPSRWVVQLSNSVRGQRERLTDALTSLGVRVDTAVSLNPETTHLVVAEATMERTEKYLGACAAGCFLIPPRFVYESADRGRWLMGRMGDFDLSPRRRHPATMRCPIFRPWRVLLLCRHATVAAGICRVLEAGGCTTHRLAIVKDGDGGQIEEEAARAFEDKTHVLVQCSEMSASGRFSAPAWLPRSMRAPPVMQRMYSLELLFYCLCQCPLPVFDAAGELISEDRVIPACRVECPGPRDGPGG